ncbi:succinate--CoA ligase subunit alpha, partial [Cronobacter sakazakii]
NISKPVVAFIAGATAPKGKRMGHAGAIVGSADESAAAKKEALKSYGIYVVDSPALIGEEIQKILG